MNLTSALGNLAQPNCMSISEMSRDNFSNLWQDMQCILPANSSPTTGIEMLLDRVADTNDEVKIMHALWNIDQLIEENCVSIKDISNCILGSKYLTLNYPIFFRCCYRLLMKLIFYLDYKSNRKVFNDSIEKTLSFPPKVTSLMASKAIDALVDVINTLLDRSMCLLPAYFAMHELVKYFSSKSSNNTIPHFSVRDNVEHFMSSFDRLARILHSYFDRSIYPLLGLTQVNSPYFKLDAASLKRNILKGAVRYPDYLLEPQVALLSSILSQRSCTDCVLSILDFSSGTSRSSTRSTGLELCLAEYILQVMRISEQCKDAAWTRAKFCHLIEITIHFMHNANIRLNEVIIRLSQEVSAGAGRTWSHSRHHLMWFMLNTISGFITKNMLSDFVPCLRLFDLLFQCDKDDATSDEDSPPSEKRSRVPPMDEQLEDQVLSESSDSETDYEEDTLYQNLNTLTEEDDSQPESVRTLDADEVPAGHRPINRRNRVLSQKLRMASMCVWEHMLYKSVSGKDRLPRSIPPSLRPAHHLYSLRMRCLIDLAPQYDTAVSGSPPANGPEPPSRKIVSIAQDLTWDQLIITLNACESSFRKTQTYHGGTPKSSENSIAW
ncbi:Mediator of RNA polymerase II transcription subunit 23 [Cichlidogyrus casuarinus]|uniref:Mediator of RNA polymerase II transcription subunit 23 n=1 Tax=Cichlidogyrus casuarinus TaxID=1844966 RepID=A0ABD2QED0_9PLAT